MRRYNEACRHAFDLLKPDCGVRVNTDTKPRPMISPTQLARLCYPSECDIQPSLPVLRLAVAMLFAGSGTITVVELERSIKAMSMNLDADSVTKIFNVGRPSH